MFESSHKKLNKKFNWAGNIRGILCRYGFNDIWIFQDVVALQSLNYVHVCDIYKSEVYTYNSQVGLNKIATYEYHICIYKNYI
jgi:hypothetical protein